MKFLRGSQTLELAILRDSLPTYQNHDDETRSHSKPLEDGRGQILSAECVERDACVEGLTGSFNPVENDFTRHYTDEEEEEEELEKKHFRNQPHWNREKREQVKRFRFVICFLGLCAITMALMSRVILNVAIVDMVKKGPSENANESLKITTDYPGEDVSFNNTEATPIEETTVNESSEAEVESGTPVFEWSGLAQNILLGSFHAGYIPSMLLGGGIADKYGAKIPLMTCIFSSFVINALTPFLAGCSINVLIGARIIMGLFHGVMVPAVYELFNKWLTLAETSIFVPLVKVFLSAGAFMGSLLPGLMASMGYDWPYVFYFASFLCVTWCTFWIPLATSTPQTNPFVEPLELHRIMRKKKVPPPVIVVEQTANKISNGKSSRKSEAPESLPKSIPWLLIITNPSVIVLTFVKFTYNLGMEIWTVELAVYLRKVHGASTTTISTIASGGSLLQMALITLVGWSARIAVEKQLFGLNRTSWRKIFQGMSNFSISFLYIMLALFGQELIPAVFIIVLVHFFWMFGAGGESMVPYDLSARYPATIMGLAHGVSVLSGVTIPSVCGLMLGDDQSNTERWNNMFYMLAAALSLGGLAFCLVLKAEPFLPGERKLKDKKKKKKTTSSR